MFNPNEHLMPLKGKSYLQVMWRLVWFRDAHPDYSIETEMLEHGENHAVFKAYIKDNQGTVLSVGHGSESVKDFGDYLEKAETKAVGRALAMLGYGTQFAPELDEEERIVDSPVESKTVRDPEIGFRGKLPASNRCEGCGETVPDNVADYSRRKLGKCLCMNCQKKR